jgi:UDP-N-acetyl-D-mannosaminuronic acid dehydrogenase
LVPEKKLVVIGMGYVGIPAAALFADTGLFRVTGIQRRSARSGWKIDALNDGRSPFPDNEPGMADLIRRVVLDKKAFAVSDRFDVLSDAEAILIDVQTPVEPGDHEPRYESLREVSTEVGRRLHPGTLVCVESTVAPGTTTNVVLPLLEGASGLRAGRDFHLCFSYERVMVGRLLHNIVSYPRIVGGFTEACGRRGVELYRHIVRAAVVATDCLTAEVAKTVENAYRDVNIAFANEVALCCESLGVDVADVRELVNNLPNDPSRPSANPVRNMHLPGAGVGGHCLPKDSWLLKTGVDRYGRSPVDMAIILGARRLNDAMPRHMADLAEKALVSAGVALAGARVAILGYAFLEDSDDVRNTPAAPLAEELRRRGAARVVIHDPFVREEDLPEVERDLDALLSGADCACLVTAHAEYRRLDPEWLRARMGHAIVVDGRNAFRHWPLVSGVTIVRLGNGKDAT